MNDWIAVHELCTVWAGDDAQSAVEAVHAVCRWWAGRQTEMAENRPNLALNSPRPNPPARRRNAAARYSVPGGRKADNARIQP